MKPGFKTTYQIRKSANKGTLFEVIGKLNTLNSAEIKSFIEVMPLSK